MHVLVIPSWYGGRQRPTVGSFFREQALGLCRAGLEVGLIAPAFRSAHTAFRSDPGWSRGFEWWESDELPNLIAHEWGVSLRIPYLRMLHWHRVGFRLLRQYAAKRGWPDVVHAHSSLFAGTLAAAIKRRYGIPYVLTEHSTRFVRGRLTPWLQRAAHRAMEQADQCIAVSPPLLTRLESLFGDAVHPCRWIPNLVDPAFSPAPVASESPPPQRFAFLNVAFLDPKKGHADLLRAFAEAFHGQDGIELRIGGDGPCRTSLEALASELHIERQVVFLGELSRDAVLAEMRDCDCFVLPSVYETFGVVLIEALACGKPVIATACGGPECIVDTSCGLLIPRGDRRALVDALGTMRRTARNYCPGALRQDCLSRFGERAVIGQIRATLEEVVAGASTQGTRRAA